MESGFENLKTTVPPIKEKTPTNQSKNKTTKKEKQTNKQKKTKKKIILKTL
jgi:hypothetical protein